MSNFPQELFIALVFAAVWLAQFLYKQLRNKAVAMQAQPGIDLPAPPREEPTPVQSERAAARKPVEVPQAAPVAVTVRGSPSGRARRFSRLSLMRDRRAVQDAIVMAAILQPCHAHRPHDID